MNPYAATAPAKQILATKPHRFVINGATYEQRLNCCYRPNCSRCNQPEGWLPSHGPYFYLCVPDSGVWRRVYLGRNLDTGRFRASDNSISVDAALAAFRARQTAKQQANCPQATPADLILGPTTTAPDQEFELVHRPFHLPTLSPIAAIKNAHA